MKLAPYNTEAMTIYSMTGFGVANAATPSGMASVEIRSVNSRFSEFSARLPDECKGFEQAMRDLISRADKLLYTAKDKGRNRVEAER